VRYFTKVHKQFILMAIIYRSSHVLDVVVVSDVLVLSPLCESDVILTAIHFYAALLFLRICGVHLNLVDIGPNNFSSASFLIVIVPHTVLMLLL